MPSTVEAGRSLVAGAPARILVVHDDRARQDELAALLDDPGYQVGRACRCADLAQASGVPDVIVLRGEDEEGLARARALQAPVVAIVERAPAPAEAARVDDWVVSARVVEELAARVAGVLQRRAAAPRSWDDRFFALMIHDLRTPLNVIGLSLRMIGQAVPMGDPELEEDLRFVEENFKQLERMLAQLGDYLRLTDPDVALYVTEFSPRTLVSEALEERALKAGPHAPAVRLDVQRSCPREAALDQTLARRALLYALCNATAAAGDGAVVVTLRGDSGRWIIEVATDRPPPESVHSQALRPDQFERLCGMTFERRGMDLALVARISALFGGSARLDVRPAQGTALVLDWPERLPETGPS